MIPHNRFCIHIRYELAASTLWLSAPKWPTWRPQVTHLAAPNAEGGAGVQIYAECAWICGCRVTSHRLFPKKFWKTCTHIPSMCWNLDVQRLSATVYVCATYTTTYTISLNCTPKVGEPQKWVHVMVYLWYIFNQHVPCRKPFIHRHFEGVMVYGYMIFT